MILGTEVNEFVSNRQNSKIQYLQQENNQLQEYARDLENALRLNKQAMKIMQESMSKRKCDEGASTSMSTTMQSTYETKQQLERYELLIRNLSEENSQLLETLSRVQKTTTTTTTKVLAARGEVVVIVVRRCCRSRSQRRRRTSTGT